MCSLPGDRSSSEIVVKRENIFKCFVRNFRLSKNIYSFKVNNRKTWKRCEICSKLKITHQNNVEDDVLAFLLLNLNIFYTFLLSAKFLLLSLVLYLLGGFIFVSGLQFFWKIPKFYKSLTCLVVKDWISNNVTCIKHSRNSNYIFIGKLPLAIVHLK